MRTQETGGPPRNADRYGEVAPDGSAHFTCASCGRLAGVVRLAPAGTPVDMGPPMGTDVHRQDGVAIHWLGYGWKAINPRTWTRVSELLAATRPDPAALHAIDWELAPFWCRGCQQCYCRDHWEPFVLMDEGFYDCTDGICPAGHRQILDD